MEDEVLSNVMSKMGIPEQTFNQLASGYQRKWLLKISENFDLTDEEKTILTNHLNK